MPSPTISAPATNNLLSNCVKAQWQQFLAWYDARRGEQKKKVNDGQLAEEARREWFRRLEVSALKPEWWNMTKDEEATVCRVLGVGPGYLHSNGEEKKKRNSRLVENIFGPAAWTKWHKETTPSKPNANSITLRPTTPAPPPAYVRARSYSQSLPSYANSHSIASYSLSPPYAGAPLYYTPCLLPANLETSFPLTPAEQQDLYTRVRSCISETSKTKIDEFYIAVSEVTILLQERLISATLSLDPTLTPDPERTKAIARFHFENTVRGIAFQKSQEAKEIVRAEVRKVEAVFLKKRQAAMEGDRKKLEQIEKEEKKQLETEAKKKEAEAKKRETESKKQDAGEDKQKKDQGKQGKKGKKEKNNQQQKQTQGWGDNDNDNDIDEEEDTNNEGFATGWGNGATDSTNDWNQQAQGWGHQTNDWGGDQHWGNSQDDSRSGYNQSHEQQQQSQYPSHRIRSQRVRQGYEPIHASDVLFLSNISNRPNAQQQQHFQNYQQSGFERVNDMKNVKGTGCGHGKHVRFW